MASRDRGITRAVYNPATRLSSSVVSAE